MRPPPSGTDFLDAETKRQKSSFKRANARRDQNRELRDRKSRQKRPVWRHLGNLRFAETGWWRAQSYANQSPLFRPCFPPFYPVPWRKMANLVPNAKRLAANYPEHIAFLSCLSPIR